MNESQRLDRREAIKWMLAATATVSLLNFRSFGASAPAATGYGTDPNLMKDYKPGDLWPLTFTREQHRAVAALCDVIIPADDKSPSASSLGVPDFIDEWISAPYPGQRADREDILPGLAWLDKESKKRFERVFADLNDEQKHDICDDICFVPKARPDFKSAAYFFAKFRNLTAGGFYTTPRGWKDIQYLGNVALAKFDGPPPEVLKYLNLD
ncbi:MAG TPA: gluconate 2-dehydrogenase subunit 3 family protein [Verrucomicrobiae bacterium]|nr:gluconate 2-dehydrogenase subunit 3 family protein [Verrucomicrobiae bacterium]